MFVWAFTCLPVASIKLEQVVYNLQGALLGFKISRKFYRFMKVNNERVWA
jgi:hypothetical protein